MAKKKRKTIPKEYDTYKIYEIIKSGDTEKLEELYGICEYATLENLLFNRDISEKTVEWFLEKGTDLNQPIGGRYVIVEQAKGGGDYLKMLIEHGADVHVDDDGMLYMAVAYRHVDALQIALDCGMDVKKKGDLVFAAVHRAHPTGFPKVEKIVKILLEQGCKVTDKAQKELYRIAEDYEFTRDGYDYKAYTEHVEEIDAALDSLYQMLHVNPVPRIQKHDGESPISVPEGSTEEQFEILYNTLVPSRGKAKSMQGEAIRIIGTINYGLSRGRENLNQEEYKMMKWFIEFLQQGNSLSLEEIEQAKALRISRLDDSKLIALAALAIKWIEMNPNPFPLPEVTYKK